MESIDTLNEFGVGVIGDDIMLLVPVRRMSKEQARRLAAHLTVMAYDAKGPTVPEIVAAIENA